MWSAVKRFCRSKRRKRSPITKYEASRTDSQSSSEMPPTENKIKERDVARYLSQNPKFLEHFVMEEVELEQLERWIIRKSRRPKKKQEMKNDRKISLSKWKFCVHADKRKMLEDLTYSLQHNPTKTQVLWELSSCIFSAVGADQFKLYLPINNELHMCLGPEGTTKSVETKSNEALVAQHVWRTKETNRTAGNSLENVDNKNNNVHILCQPIMDSNGEFIGVLELNRPNESVPFHEEDEEIAVSYLVWGGIAIHYAQLYNDMNQQRRLNEFLLTVVKSIFQDMVSMDTLVVKIMNFAQELVKADRASLFLVDAKSNELYATLFDVKLKEIGDHPPMNPQDLRFPLGTGIAGHVALTGEILNITDAYSDPRFNRNVDQITGYKTVSILCMPIFKGKEKIIGVVQMVNKDNGIFTKEDEEAFETFAVYCGLALHHAKLYDKIQRSEQKYRVALEVLSYHNTCSEEEFQVALKDVPETAVDIDDYYFNPFQLDDFEKARHAMYMFIDLFGLKRFDKKNLLRFTLTVKKNYRRVPYHNWTHGFSVANTMYAIIKHSKHVFRPTECLAMFIAALCHDLDHRGKNNKFMLETESPLAYIYSTSTMEHHHFNQTVTILQQEGHNIFGKLSSTEYKQVLYLLKHCILATDLAVFFQNRARLVELVEGDTFSFQNQQHRLLLQAIAMTGSDLSASAKPWDIQVRTVDVIFQEFYDQGDAEKAAGLTPIPMMDREKPTEQPASQVGFLTGICSPCYTLLYRLIPQTRALLDMCNQNLEKWKRIDQENKLELG